MPRTLAATGSVLPNSTTRTEVASLTSMRVRQDLSVSGEDDAGADALATALPRCDVDGHLTTLGLIFAMIVPTSSTCAAPIGVLCAITGTAGVVVLDAAAAEEPADATVVVVAIAFFGAGVSSVARLTANATAALITQTAATSADVRRVTARRSGSTASGMTTDIGADAAYGGPAGAAGAGRVGRPEGGCAGGIVGGSNGKLMGAGIAQVSLEVRSAARVSLLIYYRPDAPAADPGGRPLSSQALGDDFAPTGLSAALDLAAAETPGHKFPMHFLFGEWTDVVDAWQLKTREAYRDVSRVGRKTRMGGKQREVLWSIYERVLAALAERNLITRAGVFGKLTDRLDSGAELTFDYAVIDEAQDLSSPRRASSAS